MQDHFAINPNSRQSNKYTHPNNTQSNYSMGSVIGKTGVAEPAYDVLYKHTDAFPYEIRRYGQRFAAQASYDGSNDNTPFGVLARYIGVFGTPENEGSQPIAMTAPVIKKPTSIAMTAPVIKNSQSPTMDFVLPAEYDSMEKIPKPTNPAVTIHAIPPQVGAVHRYSGSMKDETARQNAQKLGRQLQKDGIQQMTEDYAVENYEYWGFNPPFTLPMYRRNEVWISLDEEQVAALVNGGDAVTTTSAN
jgi:hypothetical protein